MWIFVLIILSPLSGIHGLKDPTSSEASYEEYVEEQPLNTTSYKLMVPESFTSYLEHLLANESTAALNGRVDKMNISKPIKGLEEGNQVTNNSNQTPNLHNNDSRYDLHQTLESLAKSFVNASDGLQRSRPTIFHPYGTKNITQLFSSVGKDQYRSMKDLSSLKNHKHDQVNSYQKKNNALHTSKSTIHKGNLKSRGQRLNNRLNKRRTKSTSELKLTQKGISKSSYGKKEMLNTTQNNATTKLLNKDDYLHKTVLSRIANSSDQKKSVGLKPVTVHNRSSFPYLNKTIDNNTRSNNNYSLLEKKSKNNEPVFNALIKTGSTLLSSVKEKTNSENVDTSHSVRVDDNKLVNNMYDSLKLSSNVTLEPNSETVNVSDPRMLFEKENNTKIMNTSLRNNETSPIISQGYINSSSYDDLKSFMSPTNELKGSNDKNVSSVTDKRDEGRYKEEHVETTSLEDDKNTSVETEKHPIEDLLDSLVKITSSKKSLKRRKKKKVGDISINEQLDTKIQPTATTVALNENEMNFTLMDNHNITNKTQMYPNPSTKTAMVQDTLPFNDSNALVQTGYANLTSSKGNSLFNLVNENPEGITHPPFKNESASKGNHVEVPNTTIKVASSVKNNTVQSLMSKYENILKKLTTTNHRYNQSAVTNITHGMENSPYKVNTQSITLHSPPSKKLVNPKVLPQKHQEIGTKILKTTKDHTGTDNFTEVSKPNFSYIVSSEKERKPHALPDTWRDSTVQMNDDATITKNNGNVLTTWKNKTATSNSIQSASNMRRANITEPKNSIEIGSTVDHQIDTEKKDSFNMSQTNKSVPSKVLKEEPLLPNTKRTNQIENTYRDTNSKHIVDNNLSPAFVENGKIVQDKSNILHLNAEPIVKTYQTETKSNLQNHLSNNTSAGSIAQENVKVAHGNDTQRLQLDVDSITKSYLGKTNKSNESVTNSLNEMKVKTTDTKGDSAHAQVGLNISVFPVSLNKIEKSNSANNYSTTLDYNIPDTNKENQQAISHRLEAGDEKLKQLITNLNDVLKVSDPLQSSENEDEGVIHDTKETYDDTSTQISKNESVYVTPRIVTGRDENIQRYSQKNNTSGSTTKSELLEVVTEHKNLSNSNNGVKGSSGLSNRFSLIGDIYEQSSSKMNAANEVNPENRSENRTYGDGYKTVLQHQEKDKNHHNNHALTNEINHTREDKSSDENSRRDVSLEFQQVDRSTSFLSQHAMKPIVTLDKDSNYEYKPTNVVIKHNTTSAHSQQLIDTLRRSDGEQKTYTMNPSLVIESNKNAKSLPSIQETRSNYISTMNKNLAQNLDRNSRLHIIITPLQNDHNVSVKIKVEHKNSSITDDSLLIRVNSGKLVDANKNISSQINTSKLHTEQTYNSSSPLFVDENKNRSSKTNALLLHTKETLTSGSSVFIGDRKNSSTETKLLKLQRHIAGNTVNVVQNKNTSSKSNLSQLQTKENHNSENPVFVGINRNSDTKTNQSHFKTKVVNISGNPITVIINVNNSSKTNASLIQTKETNNSGRSVFVGENKDSSPRTNSLLVQSKNTDNTVGSVLVGESNNSLSKTNLSLIQTKETNNSGSSVFIEGHKNSLSKADPLPIKTKETNNSGSPVLVEEKIEGSAKTNALLLKSNNLGNPVFLGKNGMELENSSVGRLGGYGNVTLRSSTDQLQLIRQTNKSSHNKNTHLPSIPQEVVSKISQDKDINNSTSSDKLLQSEDKTVNIKSKGDNLKYTDFSLDIKRSNKVTNRKKITKKEEVVEVNEKIKENQILGKSKTVQTIKTEVSSVDYV